MSKKQPITKPTLLSNPGMQEMEKVILQLYQKRIISRQDIVQFIDILHEMVEDIPDKPKFLH